MDIVYPLKRAGYNRELRYSLRSLTNLPHDQVFIAGEIQPWVRNVIHLPVPQRGTKYANSRANILAAAADPRVSPDFILMNDDFFCLGRHGADVPPMHQGDMDAFMRMFPFRTAYWELMVNTRALLRELGIKRPKFYELHVPCVYNKKKLLAMVKQLDGHEYMMRTMYHNLYRSGGWQREDVKVHKPGMEIVATDYLSSSNAMIKRKSFKQFLARRFPEPCEYEV